MLALRYVPLTEEGEAAIFANRPLSERDRHRLLQSVFALVVRSAVSCCQSGLKMDPKDAIQEAQIGVVEAMETFKAGRGSRFTSWAMVAARTRLLRLWRAQERHKRRGVEVQFDMSNDEACSVGFEYSRADALRRAASTLPPKLEAVILMRLDGCTFDAIGRRFSHSRQWAEKLEQQAIAKMRRHFQRAARARLCGVRDERRPGAAQSARKRLAHAGQPDRTGDVHRAQ